MFVAPELSPIWRSNALNNVFNDYETFDCALRTQARMTWRGGEVASPESSMRERHRRARLILTPHRHKPVEEISVAPEEIHHV